MRKLTIMKTLIQDLYLYELILLFLGIALFLILSLGLIYYILKKEEIKKLLYFFPIPIIMIAYPSIQEISISKDKLAFTKYQEQYIENPNDSIARQELERLAEKLEKRATSPEDVLAISKTQLLLGNSEKAIYYADKITETEEKKTNKPTTQKPEETEEEKPNRPINPSLSKEDLQTVKYAEQLKQLAQVQEMYKADLDTSVINDKIKNLKLDPSLYKTRQVVRKNILNKTTRRGN